MTLTFTWNEIAVADVRDDPSILTAVVQALRRALRQREAAEDSEHGHKTQSEAC